MLRSIQKQKLINLLKPENPPFKILILDTLTQDILSPILKVSDLRSAGVTAHFLISSSRSQIKEIPAFYFISSIEGFQQDIERDLYGEYYINSSYSFKRSEIEHLAAQSSECQNALKVQAVFDSFLQFISLHNNFFTLNISDSFALRNEPEAMRSVIAGLMSVFVTLGEIPFIVSQNVELGRMLEQKIKNTKIIKSTAKRPVLLILDRGFDVITPLKHVMGYIELVHDLFKINLNKVCNFNLDADSEFYNTNWPLDFPSVAETVEKELLSYKKELAMRSLSENSDRAQIQAALDSAPQLQRKSEIVNNNLTLCSKVLEEIKARHLDEYYRMEESFDPEEILALTDNGTDNDIIRLCVHMLNTANADLINPILAKRKISRDILEYLNSKIKLDQGLGVKFKNFLFKKNLPVYSVVENLLSQIKNQNFDALDVFDPSHTGIYQSEISKIVVFINGGATYSELKSLNELEKICKIPIVLGGSEILNADEFIRQAKIDAEFK